MNTEVTTYFNQNIEAESIRPKLVEELSVYFWIFFGALFCF
jgi:hypothetical protein